MLENPDEEAENVTPKKYRCLKRLQNIIFKPKQEHQMNTTEKVLELLQPIRYKPTSVDEMAKETKFTRSEVKFLYRAFKQECPNGIIDEDTFKEVYENIFPLGDAPKYAHLVFHSIDREDTGGITFGDFMEFLSVISKGSTEEKILWSFHFFDADRDGCISREEMVKVTESIYDLMGSNVPQNQKLQYADQLFTKMDLNNDGVVTKEEFISYCFTTDNVRQSMCFLP